MQKSVATEHPRSIQPWESSEEVFTSAASQLGLPETLFFKEIWDLQDFLPSGTIALILVYPTPTDYEERKTRGSISPGDSDHGTGQQNLDVTYLSQKVQNACGPYALFHAVFNSHARQRISKASRVVLC
jgi:ubiquitin carboxyl-terminal hydrolase L3